MEFRRRDRLAVNHSEKLGFEERQDDQVRGELELGHESIPRIFLLLLNQLKWLHRCAPVSGGFCRWEMSRSDSDSCSLEVLEIKDEVPPNRVDLEARCDRLSLGSA